MKIEHISAAVFEVYENGQRIRTSTEEAEKIVNPCRFCATGRGVWKVTLVNGDVFYLCDEHKALLVMDEVVTGFRYAEGGASQLYGVYADLACYGKGLGNGIPISLLAGPREYMGWFAKDNPVFCSGTHMGNALSMSAGWAVLTTLELHPVIEHLWQIGGALRDGLCQIGYDCRGHSPRTVMMWKNDAEKAYFIQGMLKRHILMNRPNFSCYAHTMAQVEETLAAAKEVKAEMDNLGEKAMAKAVKDYMPRVLFRNR